MMKILLFLIIPAFSFCQEPVTIVKDTTFMVYPANHPKIGSHMLGVKLSNGQVLAGGMKVRPIKGSLPNGDYNYIATPSNTMEAKLRAKTKLKEMTIEQVRRKISAVSNENDGTVFKIILPLLHGDR
ncbi:MAG: hypothetical protein ABIY90_01540 [Puia sp.]